MEVKERERETEGGQLEQMNDLALFWKDEGRLEMHWSDMVGHWAGIKGKEKGSIQGEK